MNELWTLLRREIQAETRQKHVVWGMVLYTLSTIFVCYLSFKQLEDRAIWNGLLWIIILFAAFNAVGRSFDREAGGYNLYLYTLAHPTAVILSKILFNVMLLALLTLLALVMYVLFLGTDVLTGADMLQFIVGLLLGAFGLSAALTLISGIAVKSGNNMGMMALLGFPIILPTMLILMSYSANALAGMPWGENARNLLLMFIIDGAVVTLSYILFPYLWRD
ncbi:MAG: heme exporter protein CcmB [Flavobacteriales bacterium]|nr:heme exporter protein CcmB [Flavobacteriales bacterium]